MMRAPALLLVIVLAPTLGAVLTGCGRGDNAQTAAELYGELDAGETVDVDAIEAVPYVETPPTYVSILDPEIAASPPVAKNLVPNNTPFSLGRNEVIGTNLMVPIGPATLRGVENATLPEHPETGYYAVRVSSTEESEDEETGLQLSAEIPIGLNPGAYHVLCRIYAEEALGPFALSLIALDGEDIRITPEDGWHMEEPGWVTFTTDFELSTDEARAFVLRLVLENGPATWYPEFISIYPATAPPAAG